MSLKTGSRRYALFGGASLVLLSMIGVGAAHAAPVTFFGEDTNNGSIATVHPNSDAARNDFFSNLSGVATQTFESFAPNTQLPITVSFPGAGSATLTGSGFIENGASGSDQFPISGSQYIDTSGTFTLTFASPVAAFGFYGTDIGDVNATLSLTLTDASNQISTLDVPDQTGPVANGSALYYGFYDTSDTYKSISFVGAGNDVFGFDDFSIGSTAQVAPSQVPEPMSIALMSVGIAGIGAARRRRVTGLQASA